MKSNSWPTARILYLTSSESLRGALEPTEPGGSTFKVRDVIHTPNLQQTCVPALSLLHIFTPVGACMHERAEDLVISFLERIK